jgi:hypothetical protein
VVNTNLQKHIYTTALTQTEVEKLYNNGDGSAYPFATGTNTQINAKTQQKLN